MGWWLYERFVFSRMGLCILCVGVVNKTATIHGLAVVTNEFTASPEAGHSDCTVGALQVQ